LAEKYIPKRVACLQPSATVMLGALGALDRVVACTRHCAAVVPSLDVSRMLIVEDSWTAKAQEILSSEPDLIIASVPYQVEAIAEILKANVRVLALAPRTLDDVYGDVTTVARILGVSERANAVIARMQDEVNFVRHRARGLRRPRIYCEQWGKPIMISERLVKELVEAAGGDFVGDPGTRICAEGVRAENPDVIVFAWCGVGGRVPVEKVIQERDWSYIKAVRNGRVYVVRDDMLTTPAPVITTGLQALAHALHPDNFPAPEFAGDTVIRVFAKAGV